MKDKPTNPKATVTQVIRLTVKGHEIELSKEEAIELKKALADILGDATKETQFSEILRKIETRRERERPVIIPQPYPVPVYPRDRWPYREIWCSTDKSMAISVSGEPIR